MLPASTMTIPMISIRHVARTIALGATAVFIAGCSGSNAQSLDAARFDASATRASPEGLWTGTLRDDSTGIEEAINILVLPDGQARLLTADCRQVVAYTQSAPSSFGGSGTAYAPDGSVPSCRRALRFRDGSRVSAAAFSAEFGARHTLTGTYIAAGASTSFTASYNSAYNRSGALERLAGTYRSGTATLTIDADGKVHGAAGATVLVGRASMIDPAKNAWYLSLDVSRADATAATEARSWSGAATLLDAAPGTDNALLVNIGDAQSGFAAPLYRNVAPGTNTVVARSTNRNVTYSQDRGPGSSAAKSRHAIRHAIRRGSRRGSQTIGAGVKSL
jgi:hypothetical protein